MPYMEILGQGHKGIVLADGADAIKKFYLSSSEGLEEQAHLDFLADLQNDIGCTIPKLLQVGGEGSWKIDGKTYTYCNRMERIPGTSARLAIDGFTEQQVETLGNDLGVIAFTLHALSRGYVEQWSRSFSSRDPLLAHVLEDKAAQVIKEGPDQSVIEKVKDAAEYLTSQCKLLNLEKALSHLDLSLSNTQVSPTGHVNGLVDWGSFGLANPSLSLYQLAYRPVWPYAKRRYEHEGGSINEGTTYAAAAIHLAWVPVIIKKLGLVPEKDESPEQFEAMYVKFKEHA